MSKEFYGKLSTVQRTLNAPKNQYNSFGKYKYRNCEDILEAVKPLLSDNGLFMSISDEIVQVGDRFYVKSTATVTDGETSHSASAMAREASAKKGMDDSQVTGATSSYARKYCLNGLFGIDDSKDADTEAYQSSSNRQASPKHHPNKPNQNQDISNKQQADLQAMIESKGFTVQQACQTWSIQSLAEIPASEFKNVCNVVNSWGNQ